MLTHRSFLALVCGFLLASLASAQGHAQLPQVDLHFPEDRRVVEIPFRFELRPWLADDGVAEIDHVYAGSAAAQAGLTEEDRIIRVGKHRAADLGIEALRKLLRRPPGTALRLTIQRGAEIRQVDLRLAKLL